MSRARHPLPSLNKFKMFIIGQLIFDCASYALRAFKEHISKHLVKHNFSD